MAKISVGDLKAGMVLNSPVFTISGNILLKEGVEITEKHINIFKKWGIWEVDIQGISDEDADRETQKIFTEQELAVIEKKINERFNNINNNPVALEIIRITKKIMLQKLLK